MEIPEKITLKSGNELTLVKPSFKVGRKLVQAVASELKAVSIDLGGIDLGKLVNTDISGMKSEDLTRFFGLLKNVICQAVASPQLDAAVMECLRGCLHNGEKITEETFEEHTQDYYPCCKEVVVYVLRFFTSGLSLPSSGSSGPT